MRIGDSELLTEESILGGARGLFVEAINNVAPEVGDFLFDNVFPVYSQALSPFDGHEQQPDIQFNWIFFPEKVPEVLKNALDLWAEKYNMTNHRWFLQSGLFTLLQEKSYSYAYYHLKDMVDDAFGDCPMWDSYKYHKSLYSPTRKCVLLCWRLLETSVVSKDDVLIIRYDPERESRADAKKRIDEEISKYLDIIEHKVKSKGRKKTPEKRKPRVPGSSPLIHFEWLVRYQIQGWTMPRIEEFYSDLSADQTNDENNSSCVNEKAVRDAINDTSGLIGLSLRRGSRGPQRA